MNRLLAITGMAFLTACLACGAAPPADPPADKLPSPEDLPAEAGRSDLEEESTRPRETSHRPQQPKPETLLPGGPILLPAIDGSSPGLPATPMLPPAPPAKPPASTPPSPTPRQPPSAMPQSPNADGLAPDSAEQNPSSPPSDLALPSEKPSPKPRGGGMLPGAAPQLLKGPSAGSPLSPRSGATDPNGLTTAPASEDHSSESHLTLESLGSRQEPSVSLEWVGPAVARVGQANDYTLVVRNTCNIPVQQVLVRVRVPAGMSCGDTEPKASGEGNVLVWELGALQSKEEKVLHLKLVPEQKGDVTPQAWVTFTGSSVLRIKVREPKLALTVQGPRKVLVDETAAFQLAVTNPGDGPADQVKIHATLTEGLECPRGNKINFDIGNLAAGETRNVTIMCIAKLGGTQKCVVSAEAEGGLQAKETAPVSVTMPRLELQMAGPGLRYLGRKALYTLKVANPGDAPATNVTLSDVVPEGFKVLAASDGGRHDFSAHTVSWFIGEIKPGETHEVKLEVQAANPGEFKHKASVIGAHNLCADSELTTRIEGLSALMLEMVDTDDPIEVNGETSYEVRISNTGTKFESKIRLAATIPDKMEFKSATGPVQYHEEGKTIVFEPLEKLAPKADAVFHINVKALDQGIVCFKIQMTSTNLTEPVIKMEATRIYSDNPDTKPSH